MARDFRYLRTYMYEYVYVHLLYAIIRFIVTHIRNSIQSDQKENKSEQALQIIIGHVVAEFYANKRSMHGRRQFVVSNGSL
jgi:hypothetical protein